MKNEDFRLSENLHFLLIKTAFLSSFIKIHRQIKACGQYCVKQIGKDGRYAVGK
jgi:hypothetical protein